MESKNNGNKEELQQFLRETISEVLEKAFSPIKKDLNMLVNETKSINNKLKIMEQEIEDIKEGMEKVLVSTNHLTEWLDNVERKENEKV